MAIRAAINVSSEVLGIRLKYYRGQVHLTQKEIAIKIGSKQSEIARWESGRIIPNQKSLLALAHVLKVPFEKLTEQEALDDSMRFSALFKKLKEEDRKFVLELIKKLQPA